MTGDGLLGGRNLRTLAGALAQPRHYRALFNIFRVCHDPLRVLVRYLTGIGHYPSRVTLRTPAGTCSPMLYSHDDLLTVNEIFCRLDYRIAPGPKVVVDVGSNIGLSALYFLTRDPGNRCYLFEPVPLNLERLAGNLAAFRDRWSVDASAVADVAGTVAFGIEPTGRYGGIGVATGSTIEVRCRSVNEVLADVLRRESRVDLLKLDTEGAEERTVRAIDPALLDRVGAVYYEGTAPHALWPDRFRQEQYGAVVRLYNRRW
jgi:FkbM family methyltransferase